MKNTIFFVLMLIGLAACSLQEETITTSPTAKLSFSKDTLFFDTIFTMTKSITKRLVVRNFNDNALIINKISLSKGSRSYYELVINGEVVNEKNNLKVLGKDSILVLVTVKLPTNNKDLPLAVSDSIVFMTNQNRQAVQLLAWGQDVALLKSVDISTPTVWRKGSKPYLIADSLRILPSGSLTIEEGATVYVAPSAFLLVAGRLLTKGTCENPVKILGTRNDEGYEDLPAQWGGIIFTEKSKGADILHTEIRNGIIGLYVGIPDQDSIPDVVVRHSKIQNMQQFGIRAISSDISLENVVISNCFEQTFLAQAGGYYQLKHCTLTNFRPVIRRQPSVFFSNFIELNKEILASPLYVAVQNSIIWGDYEEELATGKAANIPMTVSFQRNIIRSMNPKNFGADNLGNGQDFRFPQFVSNKDFSLGEKSPAIDAGLPLGITTDLICSPRDTKPDIGAYERKK